jgi:HlyD family type I secretion membrane fusion protein
MSKTVDRPDGARQPASSKRRNRTGLTPLRRDLRGVTWLGIGAAIMFVGLGAGWAANAPLSSAVIAPGIVSPEGRRQMVQHLEGGIIREIRVKDGDRINKGDVLLVLGDVDARAEVGALTSRLHTLAATEARLTAEAEEHADIRFDHPSLSDRTDPDVRTVISHQTKLFETRRASLKSQRSILEQRQSQLRQQIAGTQKQVDATRAQIAFIREEIDTVEGLIEKGLERKPRLLALQRSEAGLVGDEGALVANIARYREEMGETHLRLVGLDLNHIEDVAKDLALVQEQRIEVEKQIKAGIDRLSRTEIVAPVAGTILDLRFHSLNGVIRPGEPILDIVPAEDDLLIEARISPKDIDDVHRGLPAYLIFPSYAQRNLLRISGTVDQVSADVLVDERAGEPYFLARVRVDRDELVERSPEIELTPGLPAEVYIATAERTALEYLAQPVMQSFERAFREH